MVMFRTTCSVHASSSISCGVLQGLYNSTLIWSNRFIKLTIQFLSKIVQILGIPLERKRIKLVSFFWSFAIYSWDNLFLSLTGSKLVSKAPICHFALNLVWRTLRINNGSLSQSAQVLGLFSALSPFSLTWYSEQFQCTASLLSAMLTLKINLAPMVSSWRVWSTFGSSLMF